jgi:hypothetical protein
MYGEYIQRVREAKERTGTRGYSSAGRAPALQAGGHRFESVYLHQVTTSNEGGKVSAEETRGLIAQLVRAHA